MQSVNVAIIKTLFHSYFNEIFVSTMSWAGDLERGTWDASVSGWCEVIAMCHM